MGKRNVFKGMLCKVGMGVKLITATALLPAGAFAQTAAKIHIIKPLQLSQVQINDPFWSPKLHTWTTVTVNDVFDKFEGRFKPDRKDLIEETAKLGRTRNGFLNFDLVAQGKKNIKSHDGPPWYDGNIYEAIRGAADIMVEHPDAALEKRIDGFIDKIAAAQAVDPNGYLNTYTTLDRPDKPWGTNGGNDRWQHDIYNAGMLVEAAVHYYKATGKTKLLEVAVKLCNNMVSVMGPSPRKNIIPGHAGPEEALVKLYLLFKDHPLLKQTLKEPVNEQQYFELAKFWIEKRGYFNDPDGTNKRESFGSYGQDSIPVFQQRSIEGHAVRATLLATGVATTALENKDPRYIATADNYWNSMVGKKMFITGGEGAIPNDEKYGPDYYLPESAYLETCASISSGFFSARMNELKADGKYMDEFERVIYNNFLSGVSLSGDHYFYENPLIATDHKRWAWHDCPCCPPMILKMIGLIPEYIYAQDDQGLYVNLFIGSTAKIELANGRHVSLQQTTAYPWKGRVKIAVDPDKTGSFPIHVRIPGWAQGKENPFDLYHSSVNGVARISVNGKRVLLNVNEGYVTLQKQWKKGDVIELDLPVSPRVVMTSDSVKTVQNKFAIAAGPIVYGLEGSDNPGLNNYVFNSSVPLKLTYHADLLKGTNVITGSASNGKEKVQFTAIPFYTLGNRPGVSAYQVWLPKSK